METLVIIGKILLFSFAVGNIALTLRAERTNFGFAKQVWRRFRIGMFIQCFLLFVLTVIIGILLVTSIPGMQYGWLNLFIPGGGNAVIAPVTDASSSDYLLLRLVPVVFCLAFLFAIPFLAKYEEESFRKGHTDWKSIWWQSTKFGLVHCFVGIPIGAGVALIVPGLFYAYCYKRTFEKTIDAHGRLAAEEEAVMVSTAYHSMYNSIIITVLLIVSVMQVSP